MSKKLPRVGIYISGKEFDDLVERHKEMVDIAEQDGKLMEMRVEGRIGYHDLQKLLANKESEE